MHESGSEQHAIHEGPYHFTTALVVLAIQCIGIAANCGGNLDARFIRAPETMRYGCPLQFGNRQVKGTLGWQDFWRISELETVDLGLLLINGGLWLTLSLCCGAIWNYRRRRRRRLWSVARSDLLVAALIATLAFGSVMWIYRCSFIESEILASLPGNTRANLRLKQYPRNILHSHDLPADWLWEILQVPERFRPYQTHGLTIALNILQNGAAKKAVERLPIRSINVVHSHGRPSPESYDFKQCVPVLAAAKSVEHLNLRVNLSNSDWLSLPAFPAIKTLQLTVSSLTDHTVASKLAEFPTLHELSVVGNDDARFQGHEISKLRNLRRLKLTQIDIDDKTISQLSQCSQLEQLTLSLRQANVVSSNGWKPLRELTSLKRLIIQVHGRYPNTAVGDALGEAICALPNLVAVKLDKVAITDASILKLATHTAIRELELNCFDLTDDSLAHLCRHATGRLDHLSVRHTFHMTKSAWTRFKRCFPKAKQFTSLYHQI